MQARAAPRTASHRAAQHAACDAACNSPPSRQRDILGGEGVAIGNWMTMDAAFVGETSLATAVLSAEQVLALHNRTNHLAHLRRPRHCSAAQRPAPSAPPVPRLPRRP